MCRAILLSYFMQIKFKTNKLILFLLTRSSSRTLGQFYSGRNKQELGNKLFDILSKMFLQAKQKESHYARFKQKQNSLNIVSTFTGTFSAFLSHFSTGFGRRCLRVVVAAAESGPVAGFAVAATISPWCHRLPTHCLFFYFALEDSPHLLKTPGRVGSTVCVASEQAYFT